MRKQPAIIPLDARKPSLKRKVRRHLHDLGFHKSEQGALEVTDNDKDVIRTMHSSQRRERLASSERFLSQRAPALFKYFASGREVDLPVA